MSFFHHIIAFIYKLCIIRDHHFTRNTQYYESNILYTTRAGYLWSHAWVPAGVVAAPQLQMSGGNQRIENVVLIVHIEGVGEVLGLAGRRH